MEGIKSFEEIRARLENTLNQVKNQQSSFSSTYLIDEKEIQQNFHKNLSPTRKKILPLNQLKTSQKPIISHPTKVFTQHQDFKSCGQITPKSMPCLNEQTSPSMNYEHEIASQQFLKQKFTTSPKNTHEKCMREISRLKIALWEQKKEIEKCHKEIRKHQCEKVEYEEIVFELRTKNEMLMKDFEKMKSEIIGFQENQIDSKKRLNLVRNVIRVKFQSSYQENQMLNFESSSSVQNNDSRTNLQDLEKILDVMKKKLSDYQKELIHKQTLTNHQNYLLQKLKNQQNQINQNQTSLLQELEYTLKKTKKFKRQNQDLKAQNQERVRQVRLLEEINTKLENDMSDLFMQINDLEKDKMDLEEKLRQLQERFDCACEKEKFSNGNLTIATQQFTSKTQIDINKRNIELFSPLHLEEKLQIEQGQTRVNSFSAEKTQNRQKLTISNIFNLGIYPQFAKREQNSLENNIFSKSIELDDTFFLNQLQSNRLQILQLEEELSQSRKLQQEAVEYLHKVQIQLKILLKDLHILEAEHQSMKLVHREEKSSMQAQIKQKENLLTIALSLVEKLKKMEMDSNQISF